MRRYRVAQKCDYFCVTVAYCCLFVNFGSPNSKQPFYTPIMHSNHAINRPVMTLSGEAADGARCAVLAGGTGACISAVSLQRVFFSFCCLQPYVNSLDKAAQCSSPAILKLLQARFPTELLDEVGRFGARSKLIVRNKEMLIFDYSFFIYSFVQSFILRLLFLLTEGPNSSAS